MIINNFLRGKMSTNQGPEIENQQTGKSGEELLSRMRGLAKEVLRPLETKSFENENADVLEALSALDQIESSSRFAVGRSLQKSTSYPSAAISIT